MSEMDETPSGGSSNLRVLGVTDARLDEYYGFTDQEVRELLAYYDLPGKYEEVREWYDGYHFGNVNVYCPWDVINYIDLARIDDTAFPGNYWINSSGNSIVRKFIEYSGSADVRASMEELINGGTVIKTIRQDLTYQDMYTSVDNIWSVMLTTGYLTQQERLSGSRFKLGIPNREVRDIFAEQILEMFREEVQKDGESHTSICNALLNKDIPSIEENGLSGYLKKTISIRDTAVRKSLKENFYHGILLAILGVKAGWSVSSNQETGDGYSDIIVRLDNNELAMIIEVKYAEDGNLDATCLKALQQIEDRNYVQSLFDDGFEHILKYGIAFHIKKCRVMLMEETNRPCL